MLSISIVTANELITYFRTYFWKKRKSRLQMLKLVFIAMRDVKGSNVLVFDEVKAGVLVSIIFFVLLNHITRFGEEFSDGNRATSGVVKRQANLSPHDIQVV